MSAPHPVSSSAGDLRPAEPSMEEILASIRRIIADDQSFPDRSRVLDEPSLAAAPAPASIHVLHADGGQGDATASHEEASPDAVPPRYGAGDEAMAAQGIVAAPQFASPAGPIAGEAPRESDAMPALEPHGEPDARPEREAELEADAQVEAEMPVWSPLGSAALQDGDAPAMEDARSPANSSAATAPAGVASLFSAATNSSVASAFNVLAASRLADNSEELLGLAREMIRPLLRSWIDENLPGMVERMVRDEIERVARGGH